jgi:hypothetical protein
MYGSGGLSWFFIIALIISGLLALIEVIRKKNPQAAASIEKVSSFGGYVGIGLLVLSIIQLIQMLRWFSVLLQVVPVTTIIWLGALAAGVVLGLFQSIDLLKTWGVLKDDKAAGLNTKLKGISIPFGFIAVGTGLYILVFSITGGWML